jgi:hypothetical protein
MPQFQVKKVVAVCFLEAAKLTLDHLGAFRLELSQNGAEGPPDLPRLYGELRRLRDYLQRCVSGYQDIVELDLPAADTGLLVAACRRAVEGIDLRLTEQAVPNDERQWLQKKRQVVSDWAVELAEKPLVDLPLRRLMQVQGDGTRSLTTRLQNRVFGDVKDRAKIVPPGVGNTMLGNSMVLGVPSFGEQVRAVEPADTDPQARYGGAPTAAAGTMFGVPMALTPPAQESAPNLFDYQKLRDPRLRSLVGVDLRAYERALAANDFRIATVMLASVVEAAVLDHVIPRRAEFGLAGTPDSWNPQDLLLQALGERATPKDRSLAYHLFSARNLLRPAMQMVTPAVVTAASFDRLREFALHALHGIGFGVPTATLPPGAIKAGDLGPPGGLGPSL